MALFSIYDTPQDKLRKLRDAAVEKAKAGSKFVVEKSRAVAVKTNRFAGDLDQANKKYFVPIVGQVNQDVYGKKNMFKVKGKKVKGHGKAYSGNFRPNHFFQLNPNPKPMHLEFAQDFDLFAGSAFGWNRSPKRRGQH